MAGIDARRVAQIWSGGRVRSGYQVSADLVLTAAHGLTTGGNVKITVDPGRSTEQRLAGTCAVALDAGPVDLAVIHLDAPTAGRVDPARFGRIGDAGARLGAQTVGYPWLSLQVSPDGSYRDTTHVWGEIATLSGRRSGTLELRVPEPPERPPAVAEATVEKKRGPWGGMSGAAVWVGERIVGVIGRHDGPHRLRIGRLDALWDDDRCKPIRMLLSLPERPDELQDVVPRTAAERTTTAYQAHMRSIAPEALLGRAEEMEALNRFSKSDEPYAWLQAGPWAGKSALATWWALHPPEEIDVVAFFVSRRYGQSDPTAFLDAVTEQLAALLGEPHDRSSTTRLLAEYRRLIGLASNSDRRLVLVVDGLDEDTGPEERRGSIASLLPVRPGPSLRVLVTSRPQPGIPTDVESTHPLRSLTPVQLGASAYAADIRQRAEHELTDAFRAGDERIDLIGLLSASGGRLTKRDLADLTRRSPTAIQGLLDSSFGRILDTRAIPSGGPPGYVFAHDELRAQAAEQLHPDTHYVDRINRWADCYRDQQWPDTTPAYLLRPYTEMLSGRVNHPEDSDSLRRLTNLALDPHRQQRNHLVDRTWRHTIDEMSGALGHQSRADYPDLQTCIRLAVRRDNLGRLTAQIPVELIVVWAQLGEIDHAESIALTIPDDGSRACVLTELVTALATLNPDRARAIADRAEHIAATIDDDEARANALTELVVALGPIDPDRAEQLTNTVDEDWGRASTAAELVRVLAVIDPHRAEHLVASISDDMASAFALPALVAALASIDLDRALTLADRAEHAATGIAWDHVRARALVDLVSAVATVDSDRAERIADSITRDSAKSEALIALAAALAESDPDRARTLADRSEQIATTMDDEARANALTELVAALASFDPDRAERTANAISLGLVRARVRTLTALVSALGPTDAKRACDLADRAEQIAATITVERVRASELTALVTVLCHVDPVRARTFAEHTERTIISMSDGWARIMALIALVNAIIPIDLDHAEQIANTIEDWPKSIALTALVAALAATDPARAQTLAVQAERFATNIDDDGVRANAVTILVKALAPTDPDRAERIANTITGDFQRATALTVLVAALGPTDPDRARAIADRAEHIAISIDDDHFGALALRDLVASLATTDADRAERIANTITVDSRMADALTELVVALSLIDRDRARAIADRAEHIAATIADDEARANALTELVAALSPIDPDRAEQIANTITDEGAKAVALATVGGAVAEIDGLRARKLAASAVAYGGIYESACLALLGHLDHHLIEVAADEADACT